MATKKTVDEKKEQEILEEALEEVKTEEQDEFAETMDMIVPRKPKGEDQQYYICVNDRRFAVPANGKMQKLPKPVALILQDCLEADAYADDFMEKIPNRTAENGAI